MHEVALCLQDTTELDYNAQTIEVLEPLSYEAQRGLYLHPTYVVSPEREPLGVFNAWTWAPCVRLDVASDFLRIIRTAMTFHAQKPSFILLPRF